MCKQISHSENNIRVTFPASGIVPLGGKVSKLSEECSLGFCCEHSFILQLPFPLLQAIAPNLETSGKSISSTFSGHGVWVSSLSFRSL